jgi:endonuclease/exonuclease/phosphatase family metal-dependent hydrolase
VRVATLNLFGRQGAWDERRPVLVDGFRRLRPDLVAFQEAIVGGGYDQVVEVLGSGFHVAHQRVGLMGDGNHAVSIASRWPLGKVLDVDLRVTPGPMDYPCGTLVAEVLAPDPVGPLLFVNHGPWYPWGAEHERELQAVVAARFVEELVGLDDRHVVLAGDFNAVPDAASVRFWSGRQSLDGISVCYRDAWDHAHPYEAGHTFSPRNPLTSCDEPFLDVGRRIDYVMARCGAHGPTLAVSECTRIFDEPVDGVWASDHFGVVADLAVPTARP